MAQDEIRWGASSARIKRPRHLLALMFLSGLLVLCSGRRPSRSIGQNSPSMRRIMSEWKTVQAEGLAMGDGDYSVRGNSTETCRLKPVGNMFEWHFTFLGPKDSPFEGGLYHGSISLPPDYPQSGPSVRLLNSNQRFKVGSRICLSASEFHQDTWQPSWTVTSLVNALVAHMTEPAVEIGSVQRATPSQKKAAALNSRSFVCTACGCRHDTFPQDRFPPPKGFVKKKRVVLPSRDGEGVVLEERRVQAEVGVAQGMRSVFAGAERRNRGGMSVAMRVLASKPFLFAVILVCAKLFLNRSRPR